MMKSRKDKIQPRVGGVFTLIGGDLLSTEWVILRVTHPANGGMIVSALTMAEYTNGNWGRVQHHDNFFDKYEMIGHVDSMPKIHAQELAGTNSHSVTKSTKSGRGVWFDVEGEAIKLHVRSEILGKPKHNTILVKADLLPHLMLNVMKADELLNRSGKGE